MKALLMLSATLFGVAALSWYFAWALWVHAPKGWSGARLLPLRAAELMSGQQLFWYWMLKGATVILFVISAALLVAWHLSAG